MRENFEEYGIELTYEQKEKLSDARASALDAGDHLHGFASELVGEIKHG